MKTLDEALSIRRTGDVTFTTDVPDGWQQGRGAFGGLVLGLLARAMEQVEAAPERSLRTLSGEILAPVLAEPAELRVEVLRRGSGLSSLAARLWQSGEVRAHASAIFGKTRVTDREYLSLAVPEQRAWKDVEPVAVEPPFGPDFARAFEYRSMGTLPLSGAKKLTTEGFVRSQVTPRELGAPELVAYIDAWWPTAYGSEEAPRPMATVAFAFHLHIDPRTLPPDLPLRFRARAEAAHDGYISETRELWTPDGRLVALNPQTFVYIR